MRVIFAIAFLLAAGFLNAADAQEQTSNGTIMGRFNCVPNVPCDAGDGFYSDPGKIFELANGCVSRNLSLQIPESGFFDPSAGFDGNSCLSASTDAFPITENGRSSPQCCVITVASGACALHCDVVVQ